MDKSQIISFMQKYGLCVLSTASSKGIPESAVMAFTVRDDGTLIFNTEPTTRKYPNLEKNGTVSVVVGGLKDDPFVQLDGTVRILDGEEVEETKKYVLSIHPEWKDYFDSPTGKFFEVKPTWLRYSDYSKEPQEMVEFENF